MSGFMRFFLFICALYAVYYVRHAWERHVLRSESQEFVVNAVADITSGWQPSALARYTEPNPKAAEEIARVFDHYRQLGRRQSSVACEMGDFDTYSYKNLRYKQTGQVRYASVVYSCTADFEKALAQINVTLVRFADDAPWKIHGFEPHSAYQDGQQR